MGQWRGFGVVVKYLSKFLRESGVQHHLGAWIQIPNSKSPSVEIWVGHWAFQKPSGTSRRKIGYLFSEGLVKRDGLIWLNSFDYIIAPSKWVKAKLEEVGLHVDEIISVGIDTELFKPLQRPKFIDVLSIGIWESPFDDRKFMRKVVDVAFPYACHVHTRNTVPYEELPNLYNMSRVYLSLTGAEGFNIPVIEAMACGLPIVYNDAPATNEIAVGIPVKPVKVYETQGLVSFTIHEPNFKKIREVLHDLLRDEKRIESLGKKAREVALKYDYRKTYRKFLEFLKL